MPPNGSAARHLTDWIGEFISHTANLNTPRIFRQWTAISTIAATLEQKVWVYTDERLYPNLYTFLIAHPGVGKSRTISRGRQLYMTLPEFHLAPISLTFASLVDTLITSKRTILRQPDGEVTYHSAYICADEMGAFIHKYEPEMVDGLSSFYDAANYSQSRRGNDIKIKLPSVQINMLAGSTPQNLMGFMPEKAWGQGFASRTIMVFSDERIKKSMFGPAPHAKNEDLSHDLKIINTLSGEFTVTAAYKSAIDQWQALGEPPIPDHPKLIHYITRRPVHIIRLSMISSISKSGGLILTEDDFLTALGWLVEAESHMPDIFKAGSMNADSAAMDEIQHFVRVSDRGEGVSEQRIVHFARERVPITSILRIIEIMEGSGQIRINRIDKRSGARFYSSAPIRTTDHLDGDTTPAAQRSTP